MKETIEEAAERWVFDTNGHKWSNNDDTAGDNYGSFIAGYKLAQERSYSEEEVKSFLDRYRSQFRMDRNVDVKQSDFILWFEKFKKK